MVMVVIVANCNLYIPDTSIHQDIVLDTVDGTLPMLSSVFPVSVGQILLLGSISQMGKLRNTEVKHSSFLISVIPFRVTHYFLQNLLYHLITDNSVTKSGYR